MKQKINYKKMFKIKINTKHLKFTLHLNLLKEYVIINS